MKRIKTHPIPATLTQADLFVGAYNWDAATLMDELVERGVHSEQDWERGATEWVFEDGSSIVICGTEVEVRA